MEKDFQPHLVFRTQVHHSRPRGNVMVSRVGIKGFDAKLSVVHQADGQVFVSHCDIIGEKVDPRVCADKLARLWVVMATIIKKDFVESDGRVLCRVAAGYPHRKGRFWQQAATLADSPSSTRALFPLFPSVPLLAWRTKKAQIPFLSSRASFTCGPTVTFASDLTRWADSPPQSCNSKKTAFN